MRRQLIELWNWPLLALGLSLFPGAAEGQQPSLESASAEAALKCFEASRTAGKGTSDCPGVIPAEGIMMDPAKFPEATVMAVADGLENLALTSVNGHTRTAAAIYLATLGVPDSAAGRPLPGIVDRLQALFERSHSTLVREAIITMMPHQADRGAAVRFLVRAASEDSPVDAGRQWPSAVRAIDMLAIIEPEGIAALRQLKGDTDVKNPLARRYLGLRKKELFGPKGKEN